MALKRCGITAATKNTTELDDPLSPALFSCYFSPRRIGIAIAWRLLFRLLHKFIQLRLRNAYELLHLVAEVLKLWRFFKCFWFHNLLWAWPLWPAPERSGLFPSAVGILRLPSQFLIGQSTPYDLFHEGREAFGIRDLTRVEPKYLLIHVPNR
jgi:hypothetical protein